MTTQRLPVVVVGAGQAGICTSYSLTRRGIEHVVIEKDQPFSSWRHRWQGFTANTPNWLNRLPMLDRRILPGGPGARSGSFATRDELVDYFDRCLARVEPPLRTGEVTGIDRDGDGWQVTVGEDKLAADNVVVCTGAMSAPRLPASAAQVPYTVTQLHSGQYGEPEQIRTRNVLVIGSASSGVQITRLLAESGRFDSVHLAVSKVLVLPRHIAGIPIHRLVAAFGLFDAHRHSPVGRLLFTNLEGSGDPIMRPTPRDLAKLHGVRLHRKFTGATTERIHFERGDSISSDDLTIIWCTGYRCDYDYIRPGDGEQAFTPQGRPDHERGVIAGTPGLYFVGLRYQHTVASHDIYGVGVDADFVADHIQRRRQEPLKQVDVPACCVCGSTDPKRIASGWDYEYRSVEATFHMDQCRECGNVYLNPRPDVSEFDRIYTGEYHSLEFTEQQFSVVYEVRSRLEARRLLRYCDGVGPKARILDVGCGDGFHLKLLRRFGRAGWQLEGIDIDPRAVEAAAEPGITVHQGTIEDVDLPADSYDVVYTIQTVEHVAHPDKVLAAIHRVLKPGGRLVIVTDNTESVDFGLFTRSYWGGYHFPRHWNLFNPAALARLGRNAGFDVEKIDTIVSPVNWVYSLHNALVDKKAPQWLINRFTLKSPVSLGVFTILDMGLQKTGRGALLNAFLRKPR